MLYLIVASSVLLLLLVTWYWLMWKGCLSKTLFLSLIPFLFSYILFIIIELHYVFLYITLLFNLCFTFFFRFSEVKYRVFRKIHNSFDAWYIYNFLWCRSIWYMNESSLSWRVSVHVNTSLIWDPSTSWTCCKLTIKLTILCITCDLFKNFQLQLATP